MGFSRPVCFDGAAAILVCKSERDLGRVSKLPRGGERNWEAAGKIGRLVLDISFSNSLIIQKPKAKEIMQRDVFGYLMKNSSFLHP